MFYRTSLIQWGTWLCLRDASCVFCRRRRNRRKRGEALGARSPSMCRAESEDGLRWRLPCLSWLLRRLILLRRGLIAGRGVVLELRLLIAVSLRNVLLGLILSLLNTLGTVRDGEVVRLDLRNRARPWTHAHPSEAECRRILDWRRHSRVRDAEALRVRRGRDGMRRHDRRATYSRIRVFVFGWTTRMILSTMRTQDLVARNDMAARVAEMAQSRAMIADGARVLSDEHI